MPTIYDVARRAGVSAATVSRVLNGHPTVDPALAARVQTAAEELAYRPNAVARNLRRATTTLWAVIISDIDNPFFTSLVRGVEDVAQPAGYSVVLCNSDEDPAKEARYVAAVLAEKIAGVIISPTRQPENTKQLLQAGTPIVTIDRVVPGASADAVLVDNERGAAEATAHLIEAGWQRIACITGPAELSTASQRLRGYQRALRAAGRSYDPEFVRYADFRELGGYAAMGSLLDGPVLPDAVFVANNMMTMGALECLTDRGLQVPEDLAVVGFDDLPWAHLVRPRLSTVAQPTYELGRTAASLLLDRIATPARPPSSVVLSTELHVRQSSTRPQD